MVHFFNNGIRGGVCQCSKRKAIANNKFLPNYDPSKPSSYIIVLEVDLEYPLYLHEEHNDLPFCPENIKPPNGKISKLIPNLNNKYIH